MRHALPTIERCGGIHKYLAARPRIPVHFKSSGLSISHNFMAPTRVIPSTLASAVIESVTYGAFLIIGSTSIWLLWTYNWNRARRTATRQPSFARGIPLIVAGVCLLVGTTAHWIISVVRLFQALVTYKGGANPEEYFDEYLDKPFAIANAVLLFLCVFVTDAVCAYRLWIIWAFRKTVVIFPLCALVVFAVCGIRAVYETGHMRNTFSELQTAQWKWASAAFASHLCLNSYCTALIVGKLLASQCNLTKAGLQSDATQLITALIAVFIESASIYTGWAIFYCVSYEVQSLGRFIARDCSPAVAGIAFGLIIVQARLTWPQKTARDRSTVDALEFASHHTRHTSDVFTSIAINVNAAVREAEEDGQHDTSKGTLEPLRILLDEF